MLNDSTIGLLAARQAGIPALSRFSTKQATNAKRKMSGLKSISLPTNTWPNPSMVSPVSNSQPERPSTTT